MNSVFCVKVKKNNARIIIQDGLFLIFGISDINNILEINKEWIFSNDNKFKIIIDKNDKAKILKEFELLNITNKSLFPEIENNIKMLKNKYR